MAVSWPSWDLMGGISFFCLTSLFQWFESRAYRKGLNIEEAPDIPIENVKSELEKKGSVPYGCVRGTVAATKEPLRSSHDTNTLGVIQHIRLVEHRSKRSSGYWIDENKVLRDHTNSAPFHLIGDNNDSHVRVVDALAADCIMDDLQLIYDHYEPHKDAFMTRTVDMLFGELSKGLQETERMLTVGVPIMGIGRLTYDGSNVYIGPPTDGRHYILTTRSKGDVVRSVQSEARVHRVIKYLMLCGLLGCLSYYVWRKYAEYKKKRDFLRAQLALQQRRAASSIPVARMTESTNVCVVCLERPKEVIILDCGHVCLCLNCSSELMDRKCPICRRNIKQVLPAYIS